jgi:hypothetical protein
MELDVGRDESGDKLCISCSTSTTASNVVRDKVYLIFIRVVSPARSRSSGGGAAADLFAVLVGDYRTAGGACVRAEDDAVLEETTYDGGASAGGFGDSDALCLEKFIADAV